VGVASQTVKVQGDPSEAMSKMISGVRRSKD